eukprot:297530_1
MATIQIIFSAFLFQCLFAWQILAKFNGKFGANPNWRLIRLNEQIEFWMNTEQIDSLASQNIHFMDVTDTPHLEKYAKHTRDSTPYPTSLSHAAEVTKMCGEVNIGQIQKNVEYFSTAFYNRRRDSVYGTRAANWLFDTVQSASRGVGSVRRVANPQFPQDSVVARIPAATEAPTGGSNGDATWGTNGSTVGVLIVGAHLDSTTTGPNARAPG